MVGSTHGNRNKKGTAIQITPPKGGNGGDEQRVYGGHKRKLIYLGEGRNRISTNLGKGRTLRMMKKPLRWKC